MVKFLLALLFLAGGDDDEKTKRPGIKLSLRQSIHLALNHNLDIEVARYQPWIEDQNILAALGTFDWTLYAQGGYNQNQTPGTSFFFSMVREPIER